MDKATLERAYVDLGLTRADFEACTAKPSIEAARVALDALKARVKKRYRELALELHPDRTGGDAVKTARFKAISVVWESMQKIEIQARAKPPEKPKFSLDNAPVSAVFGWGGVKVNY